MIFKLFIIRVCIEAFAHERGRIAAAIPWLFMILIACGCWGKIAQGIVDPSQNHAMIIGVVTDETTGQPLRKVNVRATAGDKVFEDMTDIKGKYKLPVNPEMWDVTFELPSFVKTDKPQIAVDPAERQILNVSLRPLTV